jgi:hypothetical protein
MVLSFHHPSKNVGDIWHLVQYTIYLFHYGNILHFNEIIYNLNKDRITPPPEGNVSELRHAIQEEKRALP